MKHRFSSKLLATSILMTALSATAGGPVVPEMGAMSASTAGAGSAAIAEGAETAWANPAGMSLIDEQMVAGSLFGLAPGINYQDGGSTGRYENGNDGGDAGVAGPGGSFYTVIPLNEQWRAGVSLASQGGSGMTYDDGWRGSALLKSAELITVQLAPSVSYKFNDQLSFGATLNLEYASVENEQVVGGNTKIATDGTTISPGYTLGMMYQIDNKNRIGMTYRSEITHAMEGNFTRVGGVVQPTAVTDFIMPAQLLVSGYHNINDFSLLWSAGWNDLSSWASSTARLGEQPVEIQRDWEDTWFVSLGGHYQLNNDWRLEAGVSYESSPQDDATMQYIDMPAGEIWKYSIGATYQISPKMRMQMFYEYLNLGEPEINRKMSDGNVIKGQYDNSMQFAGVLFNYSF